MLCNIESIVSEAESYAKTEDNSITKNNLESHQEKQNGHSVAEPSGFVSYEKLKARSNDPAPGIDPTRREVNKYIRVNA